MSEKVEKTATAENYKDILLCVEEKTAKSGNLYKALYITLKNVTIGKKTIDVKLPAVFLTDIEMLAVESKFDL